MTGAKFRDVVAAAPVVNCASGDYTTLRQRSAFQAP
jgi:hypothetical protein